MESRSVVRYSQSGHAQPQELMSLSLSNGVLSAVEAQLPMTRHAHHALRRMTAHSDETVTAA